MRFISNGDYIFPFHFRPYWFQQVYMWSYQNGAANPDGIMRLPGRLPDVLVFAAFGNVAMSYFYVATCVLASFACFWWFAKAFLEVRRLGTRLIGSLFFAFNPIFLGNLSKVGLILAVAMLPLALTALQQGFEKRRFSYFLLYVLAMNVSLVHPFTFSVNLLVSGVYLIYIGRKHLTFVRDNLLKFGILLATALLLNAYLILPLAALGTINKTALSNTAATSAPVDYTSLVDVANTGDIFTGLSLSKDVFKDYEFYGSRTWPFYFLGVFTFYVILFGVYVNIGKRVRPGDQRRFVLAMALFLALLALSTATFLHIDALIRFMIGLPGGWMFRSPLKWQLYIPVAIFTALVVALKYVLKGKGLRWLYTGLACTFLLMNTYLFAQIYQRLLVPRTLHTFGALANTDLEHKNLLLVNADACLGYARDNPSVATELNQVLISAGAQVKDVEAGGINSIAVGQYDYVLGCQASLDSTMLTQQYAFIKTHSFAAGTYALYRNTKPIPYVSAASNAYVLAQQTEKNGKADPAVGLSGKYAFVYGTYGLPFNFIGGTEDGSHRATGLQDVFDTLSPASIHGSTLETSIMPLQPGRQKLYFTHTKPLYYTVKDTAVNVSVTQTKNSKPVGNMSLSLNVPPGQKITFSYDDPTFSYKNGIQNPSLEQGLWRQKVGDCNAYDDQADIAMELDSKRHTQGGQSLQLEAKKHIACTGPQAIVVQPGQHYLLHFDYASKGGRFAGYYVGFDDENHTSTGGRLNSKDGEWTPFTAEIVAPAYAHTLQLMLYAYPDSATGGWGKTSYDNFSLVRIPDVKNNFFVTGSQNVDALASTVQTNFTVLNPTKTLVRVPSVSKPFYLITKETYNSLWQLHADTGGHGLAGLFTARGATIDSKDHLQMNGNMNSWYINPSAFCAHAPAACSRNSDGTYNLHLVMEYTPQRWFYMGSLLSMATVICVLGYVVYDIKRSRQETRK